MNRKQRLTALAEEISHHIGTRVEITIRSETAFTFSTETVAPDLERRLRAFFGPKFTMRTDHDEECGSFCYADLS